MGRAEGRGGGGRQGREGERRQKGGGSRKRDREGGGGESEWRGRGERDREEGRRGKERGKRRRRGEEGGGGERGGREGGGGGGGEGRRGRGGRGTGRYDGRRIRNCSKGRYHSRSQCVCGTIQTWKPLSEESATGTWPSGSWRMAQAHDRRLAARSRRDVPELPAALAHARDRFWSARASCARNWSSGR